MHCLKFYRNLINIDFNLLNFSPSHYVQFQKTFKLAPRKGSEFPGGGGSPTFSEMYQASLEFPEGLEGGSWEKKYLPLRRYGYLLEIHNSSHKSNYSRILIGSYL